MGLLMYFIRPNIASRQVWVMAGQEEPRRTRGRRPVFGGPGRQFRPGILLHKNRKYHNNSELLRE